MELFKLIDVTLKKATEVKQTNGTKVTTYTKINNYKAWEQYVDD